MEENKNINEFDNLFKEAFNNAEVTPPADAWSAIQSQVGLAGAGATGAGGSSFIGGLTSIKGIIIAAAVTTGIITTVVLTNNSDNKATTDTNKEVVAEKNNTNNNPTSKTENNTLLNSDNDVNTNVETESIEFNNKPNKANSSTIVTKDDNDNTFANHQNNSSVDSDEADSKEQGDNNKETKEIKQQVQSNPDKQLPAPKFSIVLEKSGVVCMGSFVKFNLESAPNANYYWDYGDGNTGFSGTTAIHLYEKAGKYTVKVMKVDKVIDERIVIVGGTEASFEAMDMGEGKFKFNNTSEGATNYKWYFGDDSENEGSTNPEHQYYSENPTNYKVTLIATNADGCADTFENRLVNRYVINKQEPTAPNVFTPSNGTMIGSNGVNDHFTVAIDGEDFYDLTIYSANKQVVFKSNNKDKTWDGSDLSGNQCAPGTYYYILRYSYQGDDEMRQKSGAVTIIR